MKGYLLLFVPVFIFYSCNFENKELVRNIIEEKKNDTSIIALITKKIGLKPLVTGTDNGLEIRLWKSFTNDSFPAALVRIYCLNKEVKVDKFIFFFNDSSIITTKGEYDNFNFFKIKIEKIPFSFTDTLFNTYSPEQFKYFDAKKTRHIIEKQISVEQKGMSLFEIANPLNYHSAFITDPLPLILNNLASYRKYYNLILLTLKFDKYISEEDNTKLNKLLNAMMNRL